MRSPRAVVGRALLTALALATCTPAARSAPPEACGKFQWDLSRELAMLQASAIELRAGASTNEAPKVELDHHYSVALGDQSGVAFAFPPAGHHAVTAPKAGLLALRVPVSGHYRISVHGGAWVDVVAGTHSGHRARTRGTACARCSTKVSNFRSPPAPTC